VYQVGINKGTSHVVSLRHEIWNGQKMSCEKDEGEIRTQFSHRICKKDKQIGSGGVEFRENEQQCRLHSIC